MTSIVFDFPAIKALAIGLKSEPPQNVDPAPVVIQQDDFYSHVYCGGGDQMGQAEAGLLTSSGCIVVSNGTGHTHTLATAQLPTLSKEALESYRRLYEAMAGGFGETTFNLPDLRGRTRG